MASADALRVVNRTDSTIELHLGEEVARLGPFAELVLPPLDDQQRAQVDALAGAHRLAVRPTDAGPAPTPAPARRRRAKTAAKKTSAKKTAAKQTSAKKSSAKKSSAKKTSATRSRRGS